jgi:hypothetical protein
MTIPRRIHLSLLFVGAYIFMATGCSDSSLPTGTLDGAQVVDSMVDAGVADVISSEDAAPMSDTVKPAPKSLLDRFQQRPVIVVTLVSHNELATTKNPDCTTVTGDETAYLANREYTLKVAEVVRQGKIAWDLQTDWDYLQATKQWDSAAVTTTTGGMNILPYLAQLDPSYIAVDAHAHERIFAAGGYNYADLVYELGQLGVADNGIVGGFLSTPPEKENWTRFRQPLVGLQSAFEWSPKVLWGGASLNHTDDPTAAGIWRPKSPEEYFTDAPAQALFNIGVYAGPNKKEKDSGLSDILERYRSGELSTPGLYPISIMLAQCKLDGSSEAYIQSLIDKFAGPVAKGEMVWATLPQIVSAWQNSTQQASLFHVQ